MGRGEHRICEHSVNKNLPFGVALVASLAIGAAGWVLLPSLQSARRTVDSEVAFELERARRLLHQYNPILGYKTLLADQLATYVEELDPDDLSEDLQDEYQRLHENIWASYQPMDWDRARPANASYGNLPRQIRDGVREQSIAVTQNERFLDEALSAVDRALAVSVGDQSGRNHPEATRLKAVALYHKGLARWLEAQILRREANQYCRELIDLSSSSAAARTSATRVADSNIEDQIDLLRSEADDFEARIDEHAGDLEDLEDTIDDLESQLADAQARRDETRRAIERLKARGVDPSDSDGASRFESDLSALGQVYRDAAREAQGLEFGTYATARLRYHGDYLTGRYVETDGQTDAEVQYGLVHYRDLHRSLEKTGTREADTLEAFREAIARLEGMKQSYALVESRSAEAVRVATEIASEAFTDLNRIESEAFAIEEEALNFLDRAAAAAKTAASNAGRWISDARERTRNLSSEAKDRSAFEMRTKAGWMGAYMASQEADARLAKAWIHYARFRASSHNAATLTKIADTLQLNEADAESERTKAQLAHDVGIAEITQAMTVLQSAHGKTGRHWTFTAQAAGTTYLLALFGHDDYVNDTIETYREAVKGRETETFAATFVSRLSKLEKR